MSNLYFQATSDLPSKGTKRPADTFADTDISPPPSKRIMQDDLGGFVYRTSPGLKDQFDTTIAKFFYGCNIPFNVAEHPLFIAMVQQLRPGYKPPTRFALADKHLDQVCDEMEEKMKLELDGKTVTLVEDGWSNIHNDPVVATCITTANGQSFFLDAHDTGAMQKTAENCKQQVQKSMKIAEKKFNCSIRTVVTDNAKNMEKMRQVLQQDDPGLIVYGCTAHWLNLLGQDITPSALMKHVVEVQKYFRNHHRPSAWLKECEGSVKPQLPGDTRWKSQLTCLETFLTNRPHYMKIAQDQEDSIEDHIIRKVTDFNLYRQIRDLAEQLRPVANAIDRAQSDNCRLADACDIFLDLEQNPVLDPHKATVQKRYKQAILPCHLAAYKLHPKYQGERLSPEQDEAVNMWLSDRDPTYVAAAISFGAKETPFPASFFQATALHPVTWWKGLQRVALPAGFVDLMIQLHTACASSASIERVFSTFGQIHNKLRNRLGVEKATKLVFCYRMLRGPKDIDYC